MKINLIEIYTKTTPIILSIRMVYLLTNILEIFEVKNIETKQNHIPVIATIHNP